MRALSPVVVLSFALAGCGVKDPTAARLKLADATITIDQKDGAHHALAVTATGDVTWDGKPLAKVSGNGALSAAGKVVAVIDKHGVMTVHGQPTNLAIRPDGTFELDGVAEVTIDRDGTMAGPLLSSLDSKTFDPAGGTLRYQGPEHGRQAAMLGFAAILSPTFGIAAP